LWTIVTVTLMLAVVLVGWFLGVQPFLDAANIADAKRAAVELQISQHEAEIAKLTSENSQLPELEKQFVALSASIPSTTDTSSFIKGLDALAKTTLVEIAGITVADPLAYSVPLSAVAPVVDVGADAPVASAPPATTPLAPPAVTSPLITPDNFVAVEVGIEVRGTYAALLNFVKGLQSGERLFLVTGLTSDRNQDSADPAAVSATVKGYIYVLQPAA
jgi:Tfp pilus assembly protein PilO